VIVGQFGFSSRASASSRPSEGIHELSVPVLSVPGPLEDDLQQFDHHRHHQCVGVAEDNDQGFSDRLRSLPAPRLALLAGRALGDLGVVAWGSAVTTAIGFAVGFRLHGTAVQALLAFGLCLVCGFALLSLAWAAGITLVFAPLAATLYRRCS
jgi:hypothetical protein